MNLKTTLGLLVLVLIVGVVFAFAPWLGKKVGLAPKEPDRAGAGTLAILKDELTPDKIKRIDVEQGNDHTILERGGAGDWNMPGQWPTRKAEVQELVNLLGNLQSRFVPIVVNDQTDLKQYGLLDPLRVTVKTDEKEYQLKFGEEAADSNRFSRPTYLQLAEKVADGFEPKKEIVRLGPGLVASLKRPADYYQQRRLFPSERVAEGDSGDKADRLVAQELAVRGKGGDYTLARSGDAWELRHPVRDRLLSPVRRRHGPAARAAHRPDRQQLRILPRRQTRHRLLAQTHLATSV